MALAGDEIAGWRGDSGIRPDGRDQVLLYQLDTAPSWRRHGIGSALARAVIDLARAEGFGRVWLGPTRQTPPRSPSTPDSTGTPTRTTMSSTDGP